MIHIWIHRRCLWISAKRASVWTVSFVWLQEGRCWPSCWRKNLCCGSHFSSAVRIRNLGVVSPQYAWLLICGFHHYHHHCARQRLANKRPKRFQSDTYTSTVKQMKEAMRDCKLLPIQVYIARRRRTFIPTSRSSLLYYAKQQKEVQALPLEQCSGGSRIYRIGWI